ncbi:hypothetical protein [Streptomyces sp. NPDC003857]
MNELPPSPSPGRSPAAADGSTQLESGEETGLFEIPPAPDSGPGFLMDDEDDQPRRVREKPAATPVAEPETKKGLSEGGLVAILSAVITSLAAGIFALIAAVLDQGGDKKSQVSEPLPSWVWPSVAGAAAVLVASGFWGYWLTRRAKLKEAERERMALESAADRLRERMELPSLVDFNRVLLDRYHGIATDQAKKAYNASRFAMGIGLAILVAAFFAGWQLNAQGDRLFVGSFAAVGTAFTAYLSRTYMLTYERALQQLNQYFNQPVLNSYFLTAERIADRLPKGSEFQHEILVRIMGDVLESGKEMHRIVTASSSPRTNASKPHARRCEAQQEATIPEQQSQ